MRQGPQRGVEFQRRRVECIRQRSLAADAGQHRAVAQDVAPRVVPQPELACRQRRERKPRDQHEQDTRHPQAGEDPHHPRPDELREVLAREALGDQEAADGEEHIDTDVAGADAEQVIERLARGPTDGAKRMAVDLDRRRGQQAQQVQVVVVPRDTVARLSACVMRASRLMSAAAPEERRQWPRRGRPAHGTRALGRNFRKGPVRLPHAGAHRCRNRDPVHTPA